jgi:hypothetical protein
MRFVGDSEEQIGSKQNDRIPNDKISNSIQQLAPQDSLRFPWVFEARFQGDLLSTVRACVLLPDDRPASNAKLVESGDTQQDG